MKEDDLQTHALRYAADPTPRHREAVAVAAVPLVRSLVGKLTLPNNPLATWEDLEGAGLLGLMQALDTYDPGRGAQFVTHAYRRIQGALIDYLRSIDVLSRDKRQLMAAAQSAIDTLYQMLGEEPQDEDVADYLGISLDEYHSLLSEAQHRFTLSVDQPIGDEDGARMLETLAHDDGEDGFDAVEARFELDVLEKVIPNLPERERNILALYYIEDLTLREVGEVLGVSDARISQILGKTLLKLRHTLSATQPPRSAAEIRSAA
ncbi:MAG: FliA/WhiG family RNA polymerase sigma factor [Rhodothermales bacterium]